MLKYQKTIDDLRDLITSNHLSYNFRQLALSCRQVFGTSGLKYLKEKRDHLPDARPRNYGICKKLKQHSISIKGNKYAIYV